jgi:hypothetical protein
MTRPSLDPSNKIPQFFFPGGKPLEPDEEAKNKTKFEEIFVAESLTCEEFKDATVHICQLPKCAYKSLFAMANGSEEGSLDKAKFKTFWETKLERKS